MRAGTARGASHVAAMLSRMRSGSAAGLSYIGLLSLRIHRMHLCHLATCIHAHVDLQSLLTLKLLFWPFTQTDFALWLHRHGGVLLTRYFVVATANKNAIQRKSSNFEWGVKQAVRVVIIWNGQPSNYKLNANRKGNVRTVASADFSAKCGEARKIVTSSALTFLRSGLSLHFFFLLSHFYLFSHT